MQIPRHVASLDSLVNIHVKWIKPLQVSTFSILATNALASLRICANLPEPLMLTLKMYG